MNAHYIVHHEDINWEKWAREVGLDWATLEPRSDGNFTLSVHGQKAAVDQFTSELGWEPLSTHG
jgi:hypothetical protein